MYNNVSWITGYMLEIYLIYFDMAVNLMQLFLRYRKDIRNRYVVKNICAHKSIRTCIHVHTPTHSVGCADSCAHTSQSPKTVCDIMPQHKISLMSFNVASEQNLITETRQQKRVHSKKVKARNGVLNSSSSSAPHLLFWIIFQNHQHTLPTLRSGLAFWKKTAEP